MENTVGVHDYALFSMKNVTLMHQIALFYFKKVDIVLIDGIAMYIELQSNKAMWLKIVGDKIKNIL